MQAAKPLVEELRNVRDYARMLSLAELLIRHDPADAKIRRLQGQALIESGLASVALPVLQSLVDKLPAGHAEHPEAIGLIGRAWKQIFFDAADKSLPSAQAALTAAVETYKAQYLADKRCTWHGVNLLALEHRARRLGVRAAPDINLKALARELIATLEAISPASRDEWFLPTLAETRLGLGDWDQVENTLRQYVAGDDVPAFLIASTLRQFSEVWDVADIDVRGQGLIDLLRARLLTLPGGVLSLPVDQVEHLQRTQPASPVQLEAVLGENGPKTYEWWMTGLARARSVASVKRRLGQRVGTGFLVRAGDLGLAPAEELMVLTNFHVVNQNGLHPGVAPGDSQIVFEAVDGRPTFDVAEIVWTAPPDRQDASVLKLRPAVTGIEPLRIAAGLPNWPPAPEARSRAPRVYIIGHPGGRDLSFSFQDNEMLGHEGPPSGKPRIGGVCRVHYAAPTEGGSSGSPVFNEATWELIALHHMGGQLGMPRLNGEPGTYGANEGISLGCIIEAISMAASKKV